MDCHRIRHYSRVELSCWMALVHLSGVENQTVMTRTVMGLITRSCAGDPIIRVETSGTCQWHQCNEIMPDCTSLDLATLASSKTCPNEVNRCVVDSGMWEREYISSIL